MQIVKEHDENDEDDDAPEAPLIAARRKANRVIHNS